jgi:formate dehydrogenase gamma subunit
MRNMNASYRFLRCLIALTWVVSAALAAEVSEAISNSDCLDCHGQADLTKTNSTGQAVSLYVDEVKLAASVHRTNLCAQCHSDISRQHPDDGVAAKQVGCATCHAPQSESYGASAHGLAAKEGDAAAASCKDCHGTHEVLAHSSSASRLHFSKLATTCGECHPDAAQEVAESVHGLAVAKGDRESATCTDCHSEHQIGALKGASARRVSEEICGKCHASERINTKFRLPRDRVKTFFESYHGLAVAYGSARAANCASCHGFHQVLPSTDPRSSIHKNQLVKTCGKCHPGATENFAYGKIHIGSLDGDDRGTIINRWVRRVYVGMIIVLIGAMLAHNLAVWLRKALALRRAADRSVLRMNRSQRTQHLILLVSFILLAITGFALKFPDSWLAWMLGSDETIRRWLHRVAGIVLLLVGAYHVFYVMAVAEGRRLLRDLWPNWRDVTDATWHVRYLAGKAPTKARFGRFGYAEKMEYWAVVWGTIIMGVTGLMIWFKIDVTRLLPRWALDVATTIHYYEAILACLAIVVWHFYHVILDPDVYPLNWAWWDGKVPAHWHQEEHPLDTPARPAESEAARGAIDPPAGPERPPA